jgi:hypothetical protein
MTATVNIEEKHDRKTCTETSIFQMTITRKPAGGPEGEPAATVEISSHAHGFDELQFIADALDDILDDVTRELHKRTLSHLVGHLREHFGAILIPIDLDPEEPKAAGK